MIATILEQKKLQEQVDAIDIVRELILNGFYAPVHFDSVSKAVKLIELVRENVSKQLKEITPESV
jgi:hypothetical protein